MAFSKAEVGEQEGHEMGNGPIQRAFVVRDRSAVLSPLLRVAAPLSIASKRHVARLDHQHIAPCLPDG